jgi:hypothetical protein
MAKLKEGDVIEGIFTIALSLYLAYGKVEKTKLNSIRTKIDPKIFLTGKIKYSVAENLPRKKPGKIPDKFNVSFEMKLKPKPIVGAFGEDYEVLYKSSRDVGKIDKKINQLISSFQNSNFAKKTDTAVNKFLDNNIGENVTFIVIADGIEGESSGGLIKGDVTLQIYAEKKRSKEKILSESLSFSLKSESVTVSNLSPYKGMLEFANALKIQWNAQEKYKRLSAPFNGTEEQKAKFKLINSMYSDLKKEIIEKSKQRGFSKNALSFLKKNIFGEDMADVIDVQSNAVKEITANYYNYLEENVKLGVEIKGNNLIFIDQKTKQKIFQIRTKLRPPPANEAKFYLEVGEGVYSK